MGWFAEIFDVTLLATIGLIFFVTMVGAYLRTRQVDRCLRSFDGFHVTLERSDGSLIWGVMDLASSGFELHYRNSVQDTNHIESSYVFYGSEYGDIQTIYRYADKLTPDEQKRRSADIERSFHPNIVRRAARTIRHFIATANESLGEVVGVVAGRLQKPAGRYIDEAGAAQLTTLGESVIGSVGHLHDPLLERYIGQKVVVEIAEGGEVHEHVGIFKDYSAEFIELLDVQAPHKERLSLAIAVQQGRSDIEVIRKPSLITVANHGMQPLVLDALRTYEQEELLNVVVDVGERVELHIEPCFEQADLLLRVVRELDMIVPRTRCLVRHRAEHQKAETLPDIVFDIGVVLTGTSLHRVRKNRLRRQLEENPNAALAAANFGALLLQDQKFGEAEQWLCRALELRYSLPDNGRRTQMLLRELRRRQSKSSHTYGLQPSHRPLVEETALSMNGASNGVIDE